MNSWCDNRSAITVVCDPGIDDLLAMRLLEKIDTSPKQIIPTYGNMPTAVTSFNAADFIRVCDSTWTLCSGTGALEQKSKNWIDGAQGENGLWGLRPNSIPGVYNSVKPIPTTRVISLGTLGEVNNIIQRTNEAQLLIMGGVFERFKENGNTSELNIRLNTRASQMVFTKPAADTRVVPADVAFDVFWTRETVEEVRDSSDMGIWLKQILLANYDGGRYELGNELYDPLCVFLAYFPEYAQWKKSGIRVGDDGKTVFDSSRPSVMTAVKIINPDEVSKKLLAMIFGDSSS